MVTIVTQAKKRISIELPETIIENLNNLASRIHTSRSELIRRLISERLAEIEKEEFEHNMKEGYLTNYSFIKESSEDWDVTLGDGS